MNPCLPLAGDLLLQENVRNNFSTNILVSLLSSNSVAAMVAAGCSGRSLEHVLRFLECKSLDDVKSIFSDMMAVVATSSSSSSSSCSSSSSSPKIAFANGVWVDKRTLLKPLYRQCATDVFKSEAQTLDFLHQVLPAIFVPLPLMLSENGFVLTDAVVPRLNVPLMLFNMYDNFNEIHKKVAE